MEEGGGRREEGWVGREGNSVSDTDHKVHVHKSMSHDSHMTHMCMKQLGQWRYQQLFQCRSR